MLTLVRGRIVYADAEYAGLDQPCGSEETGAILGAPRRELDCQYLAFSYESSRGAYAPEYQGTTSGSGEMRGVQVERVTLCTTARLWRE